MPFTPVGSLGDVIAVSLLVKDLVTALDDTRGSAPEYQHVKRELVALNEALLEVEQLCASCGHAVQVNALRQTAKQIALQCRESIDAFLSKINCYEASLREGGSSNVMKDIYWKVHWKISHKDDLQKFRTIINGQVSSLNTLLATAGINILVSNNKTLHARLEDSESRNNDNSIKTRALLVEIRDSVQDLSTTEMTREDWIRKLRDSLGLEYFYQLGTELKRLMQQIWSFNIKMYNLLIALESRIPNGLDRTWTQEPVWLEDALGRRSGIPLDFINSWDAFHGALLGRWTNLPGIELIADYGFALQDADSRSEISFDTPWEVAFTPGRKMNMGILITFEGTRSKFSSTEVYKWQIDAQEPSSSPGCAEAPGSNVFW